MANMKSFCINFCIILLVSFVAAFPSNENAFLTCNSDDILEMIPHPENCSQFYICNYGDLMGPYECPPDMHFSEEESQCMAIEDAKCGRESTTQAPTTEEPTTTEEPIPECPSAGLSLIPHPTDCTRYYICWQWEAIPRSCEDGLHFSEANQNCTTPEEAGCDKTTTLEPTTPVPTTEPPTTLPPFTCPPGVLQNFPYPGDCTKYYLCDFGEMIVRNCAKHLHFNEATGNCTDIISAGCMEICPGDSLVNVPHPSDCTKYFLCIWDHDVVELECPEGEHFKPSSGTCVPADEAHCEPEATTSTTEDPTLTTTSKPDVNVCEGTQGLFRLPYPGDCTRYVICNYGNKIERECPEGDHFSPEELVCMNPEAAQCDEEDGEPGGFWSWLTAIF